MGDYSWRKWKKIISEGKIVGSNNFKVGGYESLGFALESNVVSEAAKKIMENLH